MKIANDILIPELARLVSEQKEVRFTPSGVSMRPFIEGDRDSVVLAAITHDPKRGDILLAKVQVAAVNYQVSIVNCQLPTTYVLHRLIRVEQNEQQTRYILQGDGNLCGEEICSREQIIARVIRIECPNGHRKPLTRGRLWYALKPMRRWLLKIYRHTWLKWYYK